jgi:glycosyltransferase involved in cell wall biosynthesis
VMAPDSFLAYTESVRLFASARALAIPMVAQDGLCGLTSLMDALGAGKPVIMTRNRLIDLDIEALGIGRWVAPGDVDGWIDAMRFFEDNPDEAAAMGRQARALVNDGLDYRSFSREIRQIVEDGIGE